MKNNLHSTLSLIDGSVETSNEKMRTGELRSSLQTSTFFKGIQNYGQYYRHQNKLEKESWHVW